MRWIRRYHRHGLLPNQITSLDEADSESSMKMLGGDWRQCAALAYGFRVVDCLRDEPWKKVEDVLEGLMEGFREWDMRDTAAEGRAEWWRTCL